MSFLYASLYFDMHLILLSIQAVQSHIFIQICLFCYVLFIAILQWLHGAQDTKTCTHKLVSPLLHSAGHLQTEVSCWNMGISKDETWKKSGQGDARTMLKELSVYQPLITLWGNTNCSLFSYFIKEVKSIIRVCTWKSRLRSGNQ